MTCFSELTIIHTWVREEPVWRFTERKGFNRAIHNIQNSPFRTKFERDVEELDGNIGIGCISDFDPQPLLVHSHLGSFAITCVGKINNAERTDAGMF